jgi:endoribonuclease Dicer
LRTALLLPSITRRIDDLLLVKELNAKYFDNAIFEDLLYMAICAPSAAVEHDYERLELLGEHPSNVSFRENLMPTKGTLS